MKIKAAAIQQSGVVYTGKRHGEIIRAIVHETGIKPVTGKQGFVTMDGRFVDRVEAARLAVKSGQIQRLKYHTTELFSEDLW